MALQPIDLSTLPVASRGAVATGPALSVRDNGQIALNSIASKHFEGKGYVQVAWDDEKHIFVLLGTETMPKVGGLELKSTKDGRTRFLAKAGLLKLIGYDYKTAGNQLFNEANGVSIAINKKGNPQLIWEVPTETPAPKPKVTRTRKAKSGTNGTGASTTTESVEVDEEELKELD